MSEKPFVLVAEDDPFYANVYKTKLQKEGIAAEVVINGDAALAAAKKRKPSLILTDLIMPGKDGFAVLEAVKSDAELKNVKVIVLSNLSQQEDIRRAQELGAVEYLVKANVPLSQVIEKIKSHLAEV